MKTLTLYITESLIVEAFIDNCNIIKEEMMIFKTYADEREKRHSKEIRQSGL